MPVATYSISIVGRGAKRTQQSAVGMSSYGAGSTHRVGSVVAAASYRAGEKLQDQQQDKVYDYSSREDVVHTAILAPSHAPDWVYDRERLWNAVEQIEKRKDAQLARSIIIGLPRELTLEQNVALLEEHIQEQFVNRGMVCDVAIHDGKASDGGRNPHAHLLLTMREFEPDGAWATRKNREWNQYATEKKTRQNGNHAYSHERFESAETWRSAWETTQNAFLKEADSDARVNMKSYERQGNGKKPQKHMGIETAKLEAKGIQTDKGRWNAYAQWFNRNLDRFNATVKDMVKRRKPQKEKAKEYSQKDIDAYYTTFWQHAERVDEPSPDDLHAKAAKDKAQEKRKAQQKREQEQRDQQQQTRWRQSPGRVYSPEDRAYLDRMRPFMEQHTWESRQEKMQFIAKTAQYMKQREEEQRKAAFERAARQKENYRYRAIWQDRPPPGSQGGNPPHGRK